MTKKNAKTAKTVATKATKVENGQRHPKGGVFYTGHNLEGRVTAVKALLSPSQRKAFAHVRKVNDLYRAYIGKGKSETVVMFRKLGKVAPYQLVKAPAKSAVV